MQEETQNVFRITRGQRMLIEMHRMGRFFCAPINKFKKWRAGRVNQKNVMWVISVTQNMIGDALAINAASRARVAALERKVARHRDEHQRDIDDAQKQAMALVMKQFDGYQRRVNSLEDRVVNMRVEYATKLTAMATAITKMHALGPIDPEADMSEAWEVMARMEELFAALMDEVTVGMREMEEEIKKAYRANSHEDRPLQLGYASD